MFQLKRHNHNAEQTLIEAALKHEQTLASLQREAEADGDFEYACSLIAQRELIRDALEVKP